MTRLRVIAGPNGSGKSRIFHMIKAFKENEKIIPTGPFINSDEIEKAFREVGEITLSEFKIINESPALIDEYLAISTLKNEYDPSFIKDLIVHSEGCLRLKGNNSSPRIGMVIADLIREELLKRNEQFTMETVFSHESKVAFMQRAKDRQYKVYLYFVSTENPEINKLRVKGRVEEGGHDVPIEKIISRYERTMNNLYDAVKIAHRAYIFDNSGAETIKIAEKGTEGSISFHDPVPKWVLQYLRQ